MKSRLIWGMVVAGGAVIAAALAWNRVDPPAPVARAGPVVPAVAAANSIRSKAAISPAPSHFILKLGPGPAERALDMAALRKALAGRPDAAAELQRIVAFARFRDEVSAYATNRDSMSPAQRSSAAQNIIDELAGHVANNEILPLQAEAMSATLLNDAESDPALRDAEIQSLKQHWNAYAQQTVGPSPALDPRHQAYIQESTQIIRDVQSSVTDPAQQQAIIASRLQALRSQLYDAPISHWQ